MSMRGLSLLCAVATGCGPERPALPTAVAARAVLDHAVASGEVAGVVGLVAEHGRVVFLEAAGNAAPGVAMRVDAIMRTASIGKAVTAAAAMILVDDGKLLLDQPIAELIPEFARAKVRGPDGSLVELEQPITVRDLLTHRAGFVTDGAELDEAWQANTARAFSERLALVPLLFQPGHGFAYGPAYEVLGAVIEAVSGQDLDHFMRARIFGPLRMRDTYFHVPPEKLDRLPAEYERTRDGKLAMYRRRGEEEAPTEFYAGGGGLRSTVSDFHRFAEMLLHGGELDGVRVLQPASVGAMMTDQVGVVTENGVWTWQGDWGWGYGGEVRRAVADPKRMGAVGAYTWNGGTGSRFLIDPAIGRITIVFTQVRPPPRWLTVREDFERAVYRPATDRSR